METETWGKSYYVKNETILGLLETWKGAKTEREKVNIEKLLINTLLYLVHKRIRGYKDKDFYEDALQEGITGLFQAFTKFDKNKGPNFFNVAGWSINNCIRKLERREKINVSGKEIPTDNCDQFAVEETLEDKYEKADEFRRLRKAIMKLPAMEKNVISMRFGIDSGDPKNLRQIGEVFQVSRQRIDQIQRQALIKLKKELENE